MRILRLCRGVRAAVAPPWDLQSFLFREGRWLSGQTPTTWRGSGSCVGRIVAGVSVGCPWRDNTRRFLGTAQNWQFRGVLRGGDHPSGLLHVLRCEIEDLRAKAKAITSRSPPKPWSLLKDEPGGLELALERKFGLEDILVSCVFQLVPKDYQRDPVQGEDPEMRTKMMQLTMSITKGAEYPVLKILCECYRDGFAVHQVDLRSESPDETVYRPYFSEGASGLVDEAQIFLYERGLHGDLANYLHNALERKRLLKSAEILEKIESFVK